MIDFLILGSPLIAVLRLKDVVFGVMDNLRFGILRDGSLGDSDAADRGPR